MAKSPRKSSPSQSTPDAADDLFTGESTATPEVRIPTVDLQEEWNLDEPGAAAAAAQSSAKPRSGNRSTLPGSQSGRKGGPEHQASLPPMAVPLPEGSSRPAPAPAPAKKTPAPAPAPPPEPEPEPPMAVVIDPFHIEDELPSVPQSQPVIREEPEEDPPPIEFPDEGAEQGEKAKAASTQKSGLLLAGILTLLVLGIFAWIVFSGLPQSTTTPALAKPSLPIKGEVVTVSEVASGWRSRQKGDLISMVEVFLPVASREQAALVPQIQFSLDPGSSKTGFIRLIFFNTENRISGDVRILSVSGGTMKAVNGGAIVEGAKATVYGSIGFMDRPSFVGYATDESPRWSVEISESTDYNAKETGWTRLQTFNIKDSTAP